jgi:eukaryotic-like serine/threonine-protein kinase
VAKAKILVVDDSREMRSFFADTVLQPAGFEVITANDGRAGFRIAQEQHPNLIIADLQMPGLNGLELKKALVTAGNNCPLILVTAEGSENIASQATLAGVAYYLPKPVDVEVMLSAIEQALTVERLRRERTEALSALEKRVKQLEILETIGRTLTSSLEMNQVFNKVLAAALGLTSADGGRLFLFDDRGAQLKLRAARGPAGTATLMPTDVGDDLLAAEVVRTNQPFVYRPAANGVNPAGVPTHPALYVPLHLRDNVLGALSVDSRESHRPFTQADIGPLSTLADYAAIAVYNARLFAEVQVAAITDELSGIFNRRHVMALAEQEYQRARRFGRPLSALMIDIDNFKRVNDTYGHAAGDQVIVEVARRLKSSVRTIDIPGRYGGEEFVLFLPETALPGAGLLGNRLRSGMAGAPIATVVGSLTVTISLGVATTQPDLPDVATLVANADSALYAAKQAGRNRVAAFGLPVT